METLLHFGPVTAASLVSALFSAVWEGAVLAACVYLCLRLLPGLSAAARAAVWMNVFMLLVVLHALPAMGTHSTVNLAPQHAPFQLSLGWSLVIATVWLTLSLLRGLQLAVSAIRARGMARRATPADVDPLLLPLLRVRGAAAGGRSAELCATSEIERPSVFGFFRPRILIPEALLERLTPSELRQVVLHEMEHLRRGDDWTNLLQKIALVFFPLNPVLLWVERRLCAERELACDDGVLRSSGARKAYAICLTRLAEYSMLRRSFSLVLGAWERQSELVRRVHRILRSPAQAMGRRQTVVLTSSLIVCVVGFGLGLSRSPQLVSFDASEGAMQAQLSPAPVMSHAGSAESRFGTHAQMVNAVMPMVSQTAKHDSSQSGAMTKPVVRRANLRTVKPKKPTAQPAWLVMTAWSETDFAPSLVFTVAQVNPQSNQGRTTDQKVQRKQPAGRRTVDDRMVIDPSQVNRPTYAAVPFGNGWLLIQI